MNNAPLKSCDSDPVEQGLGCAVSIISLVLTVVLAWGLLGCAFHMGGAGGGWTASLGQSDICTADAGVSMVPIGEEEVLVRSCGGTAIRGEGFSEQAAETLEGIGRGAGGIVGGALRGVAGAP